VLSRERLLLVLGLAIGAGKAPEVLALLIADPAVAGLDIQDAPIIAAGGYFMLSPAVLASSDLPRNILSRLHRRQVSATPGRPDPMQSQLAQALRDAGFLVAVECNLRGGKDRQETDVLAYRDGHLFVSSAGSSRELTPVGDAYLIQSTYMLDPEQLKSAVLARFPRMGTT
jgi:hypothetical protein